MDIDGAEKKGHGKQKSTRLPGGVNPEPKSPSVPNCARKEGKKERPDAHPIFMSNTSIDGKAELI